MGIRNGGLWAMAAISALTASSLTMSTATATTSRSDAVSARASTLAWEPCPSEAAPTKECAWLRVPRRYDRPRGSTIRVAVARIPATGSSQRRIGSLVWDAGGPGGVSTAAIDSIYQRMSRDVQERFDFVAFDPRGIGDSRPLLKDCGQPWPSRPPLDPTPSWKRVRDRSARALADANRKCLRSNRGIAAVMGTANVARDLERLRAALGDRKLTFWATSYGTRIGYVYALRNPQRVRAMVMDGSIDPTTGYPGLPRVGGLSQEDALSFIKTHVRPVYRSAVSTTSDLSDSPVDLSDGSVFSRWDWLDLVGDVVAFQDAWWQLPIFAQLVQTAGIPGPEGEQARATLIRVKQRPNSNEGAGFSVVNCLDYADHLTAKQQARVAKDNARRAPLLGGSLTTAYAIGCAGIGSLTPDPIPLVRTAAQRDRLAEVPVLLANATHDGATPMTWARRMQKVFDRPMIRYRSGQHVIWGAVKSRCVNHPIDEFVINVKLPKKSRTCPFVPPEQPSTTTSVPRLPG